MFDTIPCYYPTFRLTASAVCFQLGMGYGYTTLINGTNGLSYNWTHPHTEEQKPVIWLDEASVTVDYETNRSIGECLKIMIITG